MPQMSPLLWSLIITLTISLLLITSSFLYFMHIPSSSLTPPNHSLSPQLFQFNWMW